MHSLSKMQVFLRYVMDPHKNVYTSKGLQNIFQSYRNEINANWRIFRNFRGKKSIYKNSNEQIVKSGF